VVFVQVLVAEVDVPGQRREGGREGGRVVSKCLNEEVARLETEGGKEGGREGRTYL